MDNQELTQRIYEAAKDKKVLRIAYTNLKNEELIRNVEPYEIRDGKLWAYCRKKKGIRQFQMKNIQSAKVTHYPYFPKWPIRIGEETIEKKAYLSSDKWMYAIANSIFGPYQNAELE